MKHIQDIFVDLDGTLIQSDLFYEAILNFIKQHPLNLFRLIIWLFQGRAVAKDRIAQNVDIDVEHLPYETRLIEYLREKKKQGKRIKLATASHVTYANKVSEHLGLFDQVIASDGQHNLKGVHKLAAIQSEIGNADFAYAGDSAADRPIWQAAAKNILVNAPAQDVRNALSQHKAEKIFSRKQSVFRSFLKEMRLHQYAKNVLIFVPLFTAHSYHEPVAFVAAALAFVCFSLCASGVYFLNDLLDLDADRRHSSKRFRPLASGDLPLSAGISGAILLPLMAFCLALAYLPFMLFLVLVFYFLTSSAYSLFLKRRSTADVMTLAVLYTLRIVAGAVATGIELSSWLMAFSIFVFASLAYLKRYIEVSKLSSDQGKASGRGYCAADSETMFSLGIANITASVVILAQYISSDEVVSLYKSPEILWLLCFLMLFWGNRIWVGARRGKITDDPIVFAIKDRVSRMVGLAFIIVALAAKYIQV